MGVPWLLWTLEVLHSGRVGRKQLGLGTVLRFSLGTAPRADHLVSSHPIIEQWPLRRDAHAEHTQHFSGFNICFSLQSDL